MEKKIVKILSYATVIFPTLFILLTYVYFNLVFDADSLRKEILSHIEKNIPNVSVSIEGVSLKARSALRVGLNNILIRDSINGKPVFSTRSITVRLPFNSLFLGVGNMELILERPQVFRNDINNEARLITMFKNLERNESLFPAFLKKTNISLRAHDTLIENKSGLTSIEKILIKNIALKSDSAFELSTDLASNGITSDLKLVGSFNLGRLLSNEELKFKSAISLRNIHDEKMGIVIPSLSLNMSSKMSAKGAFTGTVEGKHEKSNIQFSYRWDNDSYELNFNNTSLWLEDFVSYEKNIYSGEVGIVGSIGNSENEQLTVTLDKVKSRFEGRNFTSTGTLEYSKDKFSASINTDLGEDNFIVTKIVGSLNKKREFLVENNIILDGVAFGENDIKFAQNILDKNIEKKYVIKNKLMFRNSKLLNEDISGTAQVSIANGRWSTRNVLLKVGKGEVFGDFYYDDKREEMIVNTHFENVKLGNLSSLFLTNNEKLFGYVTGKLKGTTSLDDKKKYKLNVYLETINGRYFNGKLESITNKVEENLRSLDIYKTSISKYFDGRFSKLVVESVLDENTHYFKKVTLVIGDNEVILNGKGSVYLNGKSDSEIYITLKDNVGLSQITDNITFLLTGKRYHLTPNYKYTMSKLIKKPSKTKRKK